MPATFDHLIVGIDDLDRGIAEIERRTGVRAVPGGSHPGLGTRNAVLALGPLRYLEIMAPDPAQPSLGWYQAIATVREPRLVGWAVHTNDIDGLGARARAAGLALEDPAPGSRARPDGKILRWKAFRLADDRGGLLPFVIQWDAGSPHPSADAPGGCALARLALRTPEREAVARACEALAVEVAVREGPGPSLQATIVGPKGRSELAGA